MSLQISPGGVRDACGPRRASRQWDLSRRWLAGLGRRPTRGGGAAAAQLRSSGGGHGSTVGAAAMVVGAARGAGRRRHGSLGAAVRQ
jgi:hypothetical protein